MQTIKKRKDIYPINRLLYGGLVIKGYTNLKEPCEQAGISTSYLSKIIYKGYIPSASIQSKLAIMSGIPTNILFNPTFFRKDNHTPLIEFEYTTPPSLKKGVKIPRFRTAESEVVNIILYAILISEDIKISEYSQLIKKSIRSTQAQIYNGTIPHEDVQLIAEKLFGIPREILYRKEKYHG